MTHNMQIYKITFDGEISFRYSLSLSLMYLLDQGPSRILVNVM